MDGGGSDNIALAMLSMAETFRIQQPPKVKMAIKCARVSSYKDLSLKNNREL